MRLRGAGMPVVGDKDSGFILAEIPDERLPIGALAKADLLLEDLGCAVFATGQVERDGAPFVGDIVPHLIRRRVNAVDAKCERRVQNERLASGICRGLWGGPACYRQIQSFTAAHPCTSWREPQRAGRRDASNSDVGLTGSPEVFRDGPEARPSLRLLPGRPRRRARRRCARTRSSPGLAA
jgi:hypothetical protein